MPLTPRVHCGGKCSTVRTGGVCTCIPNQKRKEQIKAEALLKKTKK